MREITVAELEQVLATGAPLIDVREPDEYQAAHVAEARLIPMGQLAQRLDEVDKDQPVYVICRSGNRSGMMCREVLEPAGYDCVNVLGGTMEWAESGRPVEQGL